MTVAGTLLKTGQGISAIITPNNNRSMGPESGVQDNADANSCYLVAIMPCHDNKVEAGRGVLHGRSKLYFNMAIPCN